MLKIITSLTMFAIGLVAQAQVSEVKEVAPFTRIEITDGVELIYTKGAETTVRAEASSSSALSGLVLKSKNGTLAISKETSQPVKLYVTADNLSAIKASKGSIVKVTNRISSESVAIAITKGSTFSGTIVAENLSLSAKSKSVFNVSVKSASLVANFSGKSKVNLSGTADLAAIQSESGVVCNARNLVTKKVMINADNASEVSVFAGDNIDVSVSDMSKVTYYGTPQKVIFTPDTATLRKISSRELLTQN